MEDHHKNQQPNGYQTADERWQEPSAEPRAPQRNSTICGCNCSNRGFIGGCGGRNVDEARSDSSQPDAPDGPESHLLLDTPHVRANVQVQGPVRYGFDPLFITTPFVDYRLDRNGISVDRVNGVEADNGLGEFGMHRTASVESLVVQYSTGGDTTMSSSGYLPTRSATPPHAFYAIGDWAARRLGYFFTTDPLPLVAPLCCSCRTRDDAESDTDSSATLFSIGSGDFSVLTEDIDDEESDVSV